MSPEEKAAFMAGLDELTAMQQRLAAIVNQAYHEDSEAASELASGLDIAAGRIERTVEKCRELLVEKGQRYVIEWDAGYKKFYWTGDHEYSWGVINPTTEELCGAKVYQTRGAAERDLPAAASSRLTARIVAV